MKVAFTIATSNYLAQAKTVADSLLTHNPEYAFFIVLLDRNDDIDVSYFHSITLLKVDDICIPYLEEMVDRYSIFELSNALKPYCADFFLNEYPDAGVVIYVDSDIIVYNRFTEIDIAFKSYNIILTPHMLQPPPDDGLNLSESEFLNAGVYNGGFFAINRSEESLSFLKWWKERLRTQCFVNFSKGLFVDQIWLNFVPLYFKKVKVLDLKTYNVAYWNLHERNITKNTNGELYVNNETPLIFFHFSGYNFNHPEMISKFQNRFSFKDRQDILPLFQNYAAAVLNNGYSHFSVLECYFVTKKNESKQEHLSDSHLREQSVASESKEKLKSLGIKIILRCKYALRVLVKGY